MHRRAKFAALLTTLLLLAPALTAQTRSVTGRVVSRATLEGVPGAIVLVVGGQQGAQADAQGQFRIALPATEVTLAVRAIGYKRGEARVPAEQTSVEIALERDVLRLEEVVVSGQATTVARQNAASAVSTVTAEELNRGAPAVSLENALQGKVVGARINMNSGAPGGGGQVQIRGVTTILGNGQPVYVVDGVVISNAQIASGANTITGATARANISSNQDNATNRLADLNPNDIESVEVLKGAAASVLYGSRATNGVVIITTKRGRSGAPRFSLSQKVGTYDAIRLPGTRRFPNRAAAFEAAFANIGDSARTRTIVDAAYAANANPFFDYQEDLYGHHYLSYETNASVSGGTDETKYFVSGTTKRDGGIMLNTGAKRDALRVNIDQQLGTRWTLAVGATISRTVADRGLSNNDNTYTSPIYAFGYTPAILDLAQRDANGNFIENPFPGGGGRNASNPFQTLSFIQNREDVYRQIVSGRATFTALALAQHEVQLNLAGGVDKFDQENKIFSPPNLQYEGRDGFFGRAVQGNAASRLMNGSVTAVWSFRPAGRFFNLRTSAGVSHDEGEQNEYRIQALGLVPGIENVNQGTIATQQLRTKTADQGVHALEEVFAFGDRLYVSAGVRGDRSSANGDRERLFWYPKGAASFQFVDPVTGVDRVKLRAAVGQSGNRPGYGVRDLVLQITGRIGGRQALGANPTLGNPDIEPERMTEQEYGIDASFVDERVGLEMTRFDRRITKLLLIAPLPLSSGLQTQTINGGKMKTEGWEAALVVTPVRNWLGLEWVSRATYFTVDQTIEELPVPRFLVGSTGFGSAFGRVRIACKRPSELVPCEGSHSTTAIWGNAPIGANNAVRDTIIGESTPDFEMQFSNDFRWRGLALNVLVDWRKGGDVSNLTNVLFDEGLTSRDYDDPSPDPAIGRTLGEYRLNKWNGGSDARVYVQDGSYVKLREVTLSYTIPQRLVAGIPGGARDIRLSASGRNLQIWSDYWGSDPEVNNFGNQNVGRFVDLAPYPPSRSFFFGVDVGF